jgi:hypothetical protein
MYNTPTEKARARRLRENYFTATDMNDEDFALDELHIEKQRGNFWACIALAQIASGIHGLW